MNDDISVALRVVRVLERLEVPYHGLTRATAAADILADLKSEHIDDFVAALATDFYVSKDSAIEAISRCSSFNLIDYSTGFKVDIFIPKNRDFDRMQFSNRVQLAVSTDDMAFFASPEDTVLAKLEWYRAGGEVSDRQWNDISGVIKIQGANLKVVSIIQEIGCGQLCPYSLILLTRTREVGKRSLRNV